MTHLMASLISGFGVALLAFLPLLVVSFLFLWDFLEAFSASVKGSLVIGLIYAAFVFIFS